MAVSRGAAILEHATDGEGKPTLRATLTGAARSERAQQAQQAKRQAELSGTGESPSPAAEEALRVKALLRRAKVGVSEVGPLSLPTGVRWAAGHQPEFQYVPRAQELHRNFKSVKEFREGSLLSTSELSLHSSTSYTRTSLPIPTPA